MAPKKSVIAKTVEPVVEKVDTKPVDVVDETTAEVPTEVPAEVDKFVHVLDKLQSFINDAKEMSVVVKALQKEHVRLQKQTVKKVKKSGGDGTKRSPSGFAKPTKLSDELCDFLGVVKGSSMARTIVTKHINEYIKKNNLQDLSDKRHILPDSKLKTILSIKDGEKLTYFNLQTYIKQHFKKE